MDDDNVTFHDLHKVVGSLILMNVLTEDGGGGGPLRPGGGVPMYPCGGGGGGPNLPGGGGGP